jgi:hypothetical protein
MCSAQNGHFFDSPAENLRRSSFPDDGLKNFKILPGHFEWKQQPINTTFNDPPQPR